MDYPATQMFVNDDDDEDEDKEKTDEDSGTPLRTEKNVKIGILSVDSVNYPIYKGINRVGRIDSCSVVIDHNTISKEHAEIEAGWGSKSMFISDLGSLNKTKLNDVILRPERLYQLQDGDVLRFGSVKAVFNKVEENKARDRSTNPDGFVIPETPAPVAKEGRPVIPDTPDLSFDRSLTDGNRGSDVSVISGTQEVGNIDRRSSPRLCPGQPSLPGEIPRGVKLDPRKDDTTEMINRQDISELETQKNFPVVDSDEENIFDMLTQKSDIHDDETQKYSIGNIDPPESGPSRKTGVKSDSHFPAIEDLETQRFEKNDAGIEPRSYSINDVETQRFLIDDAANGSRNFDGRIQPVVSHPINDVETQKPGTLDKDNEDSETDEEGIFENSDEGVVDMFDAPTQLIRAPPKASRSPCENVESLRKCDLKVEDVATVSGEDGMTQQGVAGFEDNGGQNRIQDSGGVETRVELKAGEKTRAKLNDSIENKLNHMFDDVNETAVDEPTQILTQHLEKILESTQADGAELQQRPGDVRNAENALSKFANSDGTPIDGKSGEADDYDNYAAIRVPKILSSEEIFGDLPAVHIFGSPGRGRIKVSPLSKESTKSESSHSEDRDLDTSCNEVENRSNRSKTPGSTESVESMDSKRSKMTKDAESEGPESRAAGIEENRTTKVVSGKGLPLKKRGSLILSGPSAAQKTAEEVIVPTARVVTRSNMKISGESGKRSTRLSTVDNPQVPDPELPAETEPLNRNKKNARSKRVEDADLTSQTEVEPQPTSSPRSTPRRSRKKPLDRSAVLDKEEATPVKRARTSTTALPSTVSDRPRRTDRNEKGKKADSRGLNDSDSSDLGINKNESLSTRSRRARLAANASSGNNIRNFTLVVENLGNAVHQPSLESQEVEAILGAVDQTDNETPESGESRYRIEMRRVFRTYFKGDDFSGDDEDRTASRRELAGFPEADISQQEEDESRFEKPAGRPERNKRRLPQPKVCAKKNREEDDDLGEAKKKLPKPGSRKNADTVDRDNPAKGETSGRSSGLRSNGKATKTEKIVTEKSKTRKTSPRAIVAQEATPRGRNTRRVSRGALDPGGKENLVDEPAPKRGRKKNADAKSEKQNSTVFFDDEVKLSQSSSPLRRGRSSLATATSSATSSAKIKHKILFTGLNDPRLLSIVNNLGGTVTEKPNDCTALVTDKVRRTFKFLCGMAMAVPIVSVEWLKESERKGLFLDTGNFLLKDPVEEAKFRFNLRRSLVMAADDKLLEGYTVVLTPNTAPPPVAEMKGIIQACGGKALARPPTRWPEKSVIISRQEDVKNAKKILTKAPKSVHLLSVEFILTGILRHELNFEEHKLEID